MSKEQLLINLLWAETDLTKAVIDGRSHKGKAVTREKALNKVCKEFGLDYELLLRETSK